MLSRALFTSGYTADAQQNPLPKFFDQEVTFKALNYPPRQEKKHRVLTEAQYVKLK